MIFLLIFLIFPFQNGEMITENPRHMSNNYRKFKTLFKITENKKIMLAGGRGRGWGRINKNQSAEALRRRFLKKYNTIGEL